MTFKPEATSSLLLNQLTDRRVTELLAEHVPEDEAKLLSNGRYTCLVCDNRPIFDTLAVLSQHRAGKKHIYYLAKFMEKKEEIDTLILKRKQEALLKGKTYEPGIAKQPDKVLGSAHGLLKTDTTYDSRNRSKLKPYSRKQVITYERQDVPITHQRYNQEQNKSRNQVNQYIRHTKKKRDFADVVEARRKLSAKPNTSNIALIPGSEDSTKSKPSKKSSDIIETQDKERLKYYQNLRASGWKKDLMGNWVREDDVEFDSDEDPPPEYEEAMKEKL